MKSTMNGGEPALHGLAPKLNGLAPKRANSASVRRRKTNNPSLESLSSCRHEELAISTVSERQGQRKWYSNPARSSIHSKYRPRPRTVQCKRGSGWDVEEGKKSDFETLPPLPPQTKENDTIMYNFSSSNLGERREIIVLMSDDWLIRHETQSHVNSGSVFKSDAVIMCFNYKYKKESVSQIFFWQTM